MRSLTSKLAHQLISKPGSWALVAVLITILLGAAEHYPKTASAQSPHVGANVVTWRTLQSAHHVPTSYQGRPETVAKLQSGAAPLAMASADFNRDGIADLVIGYASSTGGILAVHRGNLDAFAPQTHASWLAIAHNQFPAPFLPQATVIDVPEAPQFIVTGDFDGDGDIDILTGARGSQHLYLLVGKGKGKFSDPQAISLPGALTALAAGPVGARDGKTDVVAGVKTTQSAAVLVYKGSAGGLAQAPVSYPVPQPATQLEIGDLHGDGFNDVAVLAGGEVLIVHPTAQPGEDTSALIERVPVGGARSIAVGTFVWNRRSRNQLAVLTQSGIVQVLSAEELDTRPFTKEEMRIRRIPSLRAKLPAEVTPQWDGESHPWNVVKSASVSAPMSGKVRLIAAGLAHTSPMDLMVVDPSDSRLHVLPANTSFDSADDAGELTVETGDSPIAVLPVRVNVDARRGLLMLGRSGLQPKTMAPLPDPTYTVNRLDDPTALVANASAYCNGVANDCSFRQAVIKANSVSGADTIMLPAGTITLSITGQGEGAAETGDVDVTDTVSIMGSVDGGGNPTSIITGAGGWNDKFISVNKEGTSDAGLSISNVIFKNGNNTNLASTESGYDALGGAVAFYGCAAAGGGCTVGSGSSSLSITNVQFLNNSIGNNSSTGCSGSANIDCGGGLLSQFGNTTISGATFTGNKATNGRGGALVLQGAVETMSVSSSTFTSNTSGIEGGAIDVDFQNGYATGSISTHSSTISGNTSGTVTAADGGGFYFEMQNGSLGPGTTATATIDQETVISGNSAQRGGGIDFLGTSGPSPNNTSLTVSKVTITGNEATGASSDGGGGIYVPDAGTLTVQYSRIVGNTAPSGKPTGIAIDPSGATVTATDNWWGCNTGPSATPCDTVALTSGTDATITDTPYIVLTLGAVPTTLQPQPPGTTISALTADFLHESSGTIALTNINVLLGLPITFGATHGTISSPQSTIQSNGMATANVSPDTSCGTPLVASAKVDNGTTTHNITVVCPDLTITKSNNVSGSVPLATPTWTWTIIGSNNSAATAPAQFSNGQTIVSDTLPSGNVSYSVLSTVTSFPTGSASCTITSNVLNCAATSLVIMNAGGSLTVQVGATATAAGSYTNPTGGSCAVDPGNDIIESNESNNACASNTVTVVAPPTISKAFGATSIPVGGTTTLTFTLTNPSANTVAETGVAFSDTLTGGLQVAGTPNLSNTCGTFTGATSGSTSLSLTGGTIPIAGSCTISLNVTDNTGGITVNQVTAVTSTNGGTGAGSNLAELLVAYPPTISKSFADFSIPLNGTTTLTFSITNPNGDFPLHGISFSDSFPSGLLVSNPSGESDNCGGTVTATPGTGTVSLSGGSVPPNNASCTISVNVTGTAAEVANNTTGVVNSTEGGPGTTSNTATLTIVAPPSISKAFSPATVPLGNDSTVTFLITNPNTGNVVSSAAVAIRNSARGIGQRITPHPDVPTGGNLSNISFSDSLPSGLLVSTSPGVSNSCNGAVTADSGTGTISLSGGMLATGGSCAITVNVTPASATTYPNQTGTVSSTEGGTGAASNTATLTVVTPACYAPPTNMVSWWPAEGNANDIAGSNSGTVIGLTGFATGEVGQAFSFDGTGFDRSNSFVYVSDSASLDPLASSGLSYDMWLNPSQVGGTNSGNRVMLGRNGSYAVYLDSSGNLNVTVQNPDLSESPLWTTTQPIALNDWSHIAFTFQTHNFNASDLVIYVNGTAVTTTFIANNYASNFVIKYPGTALDIGGDPYDFPNDGYFAGLLDELEFFNRALTTAEVQDIYLAGNKGKCKSNAMIAKAFNPTGIPIGGTSTLTFTITNPNAEVDLTGISFTDNLQTGLTVAASPAPTNSCGGTLTASGETISLSGGAVAEGTGNTCTVTVPVTSSTAGTVNNTTGAISTNEVGTGSTSNTVTLSVLAPPTITKGFSPGNIAVDGTSTLSFTISNPNSSASLTGVAFSDPLPSGVQVAGTPNAVGNCGGGTFSATASSTTVGLTGGTIAPSGSCTLSVSVTATTGGLKNNTTGAVGSTNGGTGTVSNTATLTVANPPTITKSFSPTTIAVGGVSTLSLTLTNPNPSVTLTGVSFSDTMPPGMQVANPAGIGSTCSGTWNATPGDTFLNFGGGTLPPGSSCTLTVNVTSITGGTENNVTNPPQSNEGGTGVSSNTATLTVIAPPGISKAFELLSTIAASPTGATESGPTVTITTTSPHGFATGQSVTIAGVGVVGYNGTFTIASVPTTTTFTYTDTNTGLAASGGGTATVPITTMPLNSTATLAFTLTNPNPTALTGVSFTDALPSGLQVATTPNASAPCGTFAPNAGATTLSFSAGTLASSATCIVSVNITGTTAGVKNNTTGNVTSTQGGTGGTASATVTVLSPPSISKAFGVANIPPGGTTTLTFTITNPNAANQLLGVGFTDPLPSGLAVASTPGASTSCGGTFAPNAGDTTLNFSGATIAAAGTCTVSVNITGTTPGVKNNTTGAVTSTNAGTGNTASASITVASPPTISKAFGASSILLNGTTSLTFTITNPNTSLGLTGISFTDSLPAGMTVPNGTTTPCGGSLTAASNVLTFSGGSITASGNCSFSVTVTGSTAGVWNNTTGAISSNESGAGTTSNTATLTVVAPPTISKSFDAATIPLNGTSVLSFTITNNNSTTTLTGIGFTDTLPAGLTVASGTSSTCGGGTLTATAPGTIALTGGSIAASSTCVISVTVTGATAGVKNNTTGAITSTNGGTGTTSNTATITVVAPPTISKGFGAPNIALNGTTSLTFTLTNPNSTVALTGVGFTDTLPSGLTVPTTGAQPACGGGVLTTTAPGTITLSGGSIAMSSNCQFSVTVTGATSGVKNNTTGNVTSTNGGTGNMASASITVAAPPTISKAFGASAIPLNGTTSLTFTITNPNASIGLTGVGFTDALPAGMTVASGTSTTCNGGTLTTTSPGTISLSGGTIAASGMCSFSVTVTGSTAGIKNNTTGAITSNEGGTGTTSNTATITVVAPPAISKVFGAGSIPLNGTTSLSFTIQNNNVTTTLTGIGFSDTLPAGLVISTPNGLSSSCGGTITANAGSGAISLSGASLASSASCTLSLNVTGTTAGAKNNTTGNVTSTEGGTGNTASASLAVVAPPTISKAFGASSVLLGGMTSLTFTLTNPAANSVSETGVAFTDTLPSGLVVATPNGLTNSCGGSPSATAGGSSISLTSGNIPTGSSCVLIVNVTATSYGTKNNITSAVSSTNGGTGATSNTATISVSQPPAITSANSATFTIGVAGSFTVTTTGFPTPSIKESGPLPNGLTFVDNGNGTGTLHGTPMVFIGGDFGITFTAQNGVGSPATQPFTIILQQAPAFTSANNAVFVYGVPNSFTITTTGFPAPSIHESGTLPPWLTFVDHGNGTATLSGTPSYASGTFALVLTATNVVTTTTQNFTLIVSGLNVSPSTLDFGSIYLNSKHTLTVTAMNVGSSNVTISGVGITPGTANAVAYTFVNHCTAALKPGKSCTISVTFLGDAVGTLTATLSVTDNTVGSPQQVSLTGTVIDPVAQFNPAKLAFGTQAVGSSTTLPVQLTNSGQTPLDIDTISIGGTDAGDFSQTNNCPAIFSSTMTCTISVTFTPTVKGARTGTLIVVDNVAAGRSTVALTGTGH